MGRAVIASNQSIKTQRKFFQYKSKTLLIFSFKAQLPRNIGGLGVSRQSERHVFQWYAGIMLRFT